VGIGNPGNPDMMDGVDANMINGASTEVHGGAGLIATAGGIDTHIHFICPQLIDQALFSGITTMPGGGTGPADGTNATTVTPGAWNIRKMLESAEAFPQGTAKGMGCYHSFLETKFISTRKNYIKANNFQTLR